MTDGPEPTEQQEPAEQPAPKGQAEPAAADSIGTALAPLRDRYAQWMGLDPDSVLADREEPVDEIRAMQLVLRLERATPPSWTMALAAAAGGAAALCLDARSEPGGEWHEAVLAYCIGHIRKVTRRARAGQWLACADIPGLTIEQLAADPEIRAEVRVLVPGLVAELDPKISRLQVGGTDAPVDTVSAPGIEPAGALHLWLPPEPQMTLGKMMAQAGHAGMIAAALMTGDDQPAAIRWRDAGCPTIVHGRTAGWPELEAAVRDAAQAWRADRLLAVRDAGFTEIAPGTITVIARAPALH